MPYNFSIRIVRVRGIVRVITEYSMGLVGKRLFHDHEKWLSLELKLTKTDTINLPL
jgi:hypothetical protein